MAYMNTKKGVIGILTGGGDVPGLNPAIRAVTIRAIREGYEVIGLRRGWASLVDMVREEDYDNSQNFQSLTEELVNRCRPHWWNFPSHLADQSRASQLGNGSCSPARLVCGSRERCHP